MSIKRLFLLICSCVCLVWTACGDTGGVGTPCELLQKTSKDNAKALGDKARVVEPYFNCSLPYCILNYYDKEKEGVGYCTKICQQASDCPTGYSCTVFLEVKALPPNVGQHFLKLLGKKLCTRPGPLPAN